MLIDIGVNLTDRRFDADRPQVIERAFEGGVEQLICISSNLNESAQGQILAAQYPGRIFTTAGIHPHQAKEFEGPAIDRIRELVMQPQVIAIGECGLDYDRDFSPRPSQRQCFEAQLNLAQELGMPLFLHQRGAHADFMSTLSGSNLQAVVHCFTDNREALHSYLKAGLYIGITGWICDERRGIPLQEMVADIPLDRLLLETDAPYLVPRDLRPKPKKGRNEPSFLRHIAQRVAEYMDRDPGEVFAASTANARRLFSIPDCPKVEPVTEL